MDLLIRLREWGRRGGDPPSLPFPPPLPPPSCAEQLPSPFPRDPESFRDPSPVFFFLSFPLGPRPRAPPHFSPPPTKRPTPNWAARDVIAGAYRFLKPYVDGLPQFPDLGPPAGNSDARTAERLADLRLRDG